MNVIRCATGQHQLSSLVKSKPSNYTMTRQYDPKIKIDPTQKTYKPTRLPLDIKERQYDTDPYKLLPHSNYKPHWEKVKQKTRQLPRKPKETPVKQPVKTKGSPKKESKVSFAQEPPVRVSKQGISCMSLYLLYLYKHYLYVTFFILLF